jgi:branched-chain amino acid transport system ATP-binding protein
MNASKPILLSIRNLEVHYGHIQAVKNISMDIREGEITAIVGANGAGKSTSLLAISGIVPIHSGSLGYLNEGKTFNLKELASHQIVQLGVAHVPEGRAILTHLTVEENLLLGAYSRKDTQKVQSDLDDYMNMFPILRSRRSELAGNLSGGEQQMLAIARALMSRPKLLLLDEPSMGLAPLKVKEIFQALVDLNQRGQTILLVEQNIKQALKISHQACVLENGSMVLSGTGSQLLHDKRVIEAYLGA